MPPDMGQHGHRYAPCFLFPKTPRRGCRLSRQWNTVINTSSAAQENSSEEMRVVNKYNYHRSLNMGIHVTTEAVAVTQPV